MALLNINGRVVHSSVLDAVRWQSKPSAWGNTLERYFMQDVMVDLETRGKTPGCALLSYGLVGFNWRNGEMDDGVYGVIKGGQEDLFDEPDTMNWWAQQSEEAKAVLSAPGVPLREGLTAVNEYIGRFGPNVRVWGNGADFDNAILSAAYRAAGVKPAWQFWNNRCYRTVKNLAPHVKLVRQGTYHNALDDARSQARHLMAIVEATTLVLA